jgi:hypothetical protein
MFGYYFQIQYLLPVANGDPRDRQDRRHLVSGFLDRQET